MHEVIENATGGRARKVCKQWKEHEIAAEYMNGKEKWVFCQR